MENLKCQIGRKGVLTRLSDESKLQHVVLEECFRNNTFLVPCARSGGISVGQYHQIRFTNKNIVYAYHAKVVRFISESIVCLQLILPGTRIRSDRVPVDKKQIKIILQDGKQQVPVTVMDISVSGARLFSETRLGKINDVFNIELTLADGTKSIRLPCRVRYVRTDKTNIDPTVSTNYHHGVEFLQLASHVENFLYKFVS